MSIDNVLMLYKFQRRWFESSGGSNKGQKCRLGPPGKVDSWAPLPSSEKKKNLMYLEKYLCECGMQCLTPLRRNTSNISFTYLPVVIMIHVIENLAVKRVSVSCEIDKKNQFKISTWKNLYWTELMCKSILLKFV